MTNSRPDSRRRAGAVTHARLAALVGLALAALPAAAGPRPALTGSSLAAGKFLVASRSLQDTHFARTVVLLVEYDAYGAKGLIINRRTALRLSSVFPKYESIHADRQHVFDGGPVGRDTLLMLVRAEGETEHSLRVFGDVHLSTSETLLERLLRADKEPADFRVYSGYAGWGPGQLEAEVERDDWYVVAPDAAFVFDVDPERAWLGLLPPDPTRTTRLLAPPVEGGPIASAGQAPDTRGSRGPAGVERNGVQPPKQSYWQRSPPGGIVGRQPVSRHDVRTTGAHSEHCPPGATS